MEFPEAPTPAWESRIKEVREHQDQYQEKYTIDGSEIPHYEPGSWVYVRHHPLSSAAEKFHAGFAARWEGPFQVRQRLSGQVYLVDRDGASIKVHEGQLKSAALRPISAQGAEARPIPDGTPVEEDAPRRVPDIPKTVPTPRERTAPRRKRGRPPKAVRQGKQEAATVTRPTSPPGYNLRPRTRQ